MTHSKKQNIKHHLGKIKAIFPEVFSSEMGKSLEEEINLDNVFNLNPRTQKIIWVVIVFNSPKYSSYKIPF